MSDLDSFDLSVRTVHLLGQCGVTTAPQLAELHLLQVLARGGGHLVIAEARTAQLAIAGLPGPAVIASDSVLGDGRPERLTAEWIADLGARLELRGWTSAGPGRWRQWLRDEGAVNFARLEPGPAVLRLQLTQVDGDESIGFTLVLAPARSMADLTDAVLSLDRDLQAVRCREAIVTRILPEVGPCWLATRGGYLPLTPPRPTLPGPLATGP